VSAADGYASVKSAIGTAGIAALAERAERIVSS
jgi:hypothetical protein